MSSSNFDLINGTNVVPESVVLDQNDLTTISLLDLDSNECLGYMFWEKYPRSCFRSSLKFESRTFIFFQRLSGAAGNFCYLLLR